MIITEKEKLIDIFQYYYNCLYNLNNTKEDDRIIHNVCIDLDTEIYKM